MRGRDQRTDGGGMNTGWTRIRRWALTRLVLEAAALFGTIAVASRALSFFVPAEPSALHAGLAMARNLILAGLLLAVYTLLIRRLERRSAREVDPRLSCAQFPAGAVLGIAMLASVYGILWAGGIARSLSARDPSDVLVQPIAA
jgi:hypothetical protein